MAFRALAINLNGMDLNLAIGLIEGSSKVVSEDPSDTDIRNLLKAERLENKMGYDQTWYVLTGDRECGEPVGKPPER